MTKSELYKILDIDGPDEFIYYDNLAALFEEDAYIEPELISDIFKDVEADVLADLTENYFEEFLKSIPDEESELYMLVDNIKRVFLGKIGEEVTDDSAIALADEVIKFRKWYVLDELACEKNSSSEHSVRDARYNILAAKYTGEDFAYDFDEALMYELEGYDISVAEMISGENE